MTNNKQYVNFTLNSSKFNSAKISACIVFCECCIIALYIYVRRVMYV